MKIGMVVYSLSGHTLAVAERVKERLAAGGHAVTLLRLETVGPATVSGEKDELRTRPAVDQYDAVVFACPVRGGAPPPPMATYLSGIPSLQGKKVAAAKAKLRARGAQSLLFLNGQDHLIDQVP